MGDGRGLRLGLRAEMKQQRRVAAVIQDHVGELILRPFEDLVGELPVLFERLAFVGEYRSASGCNRGGGVVLSRVDVARGPAHLRPERLQRLDQHRRLDGHVERPRDARPAQRLDRRVLLADRHQAGHLGLGDGDLLAPPIGERKVCDPVIGEILRLGYGAHHALLSVSKKVRERRCRIDTPSLASLTTRCNAPWGGAKLYRNRRIQLFDERKPAHSRPSF